VYLIACLLSPFHYADVALGVFQRTPIKYWRRFTASTQRCRPTSAALADESWTCKSHLSPHTYLYRLKHWQSYRRADPRRLRICRSPNDAIVHAYRYCAASPHDKILQPVSTCYSGANANVEEKFDRDLWPFDLTTSAWRGPAHYYGPLLPWTIGLLDYLYRVWCRQIPQFSFYSADKQGDKQTQLNALPHTGFCTVVVDTG